MRHRMTACGIVALMVIGGWATLAHAEEAGAKTKVDPALAKTRADDADVKTAKDEGWKNQWYLFWGPANVHAELRESEGLINRQLNHTVGVLIPGWKRPRTFKDWSNEGRLFDLHAGAGRDLGPKFGWFVDVGGIVGTVRNRETYWLPVPLRTHIDFSRQLYFIATGVDFYPWGKPCLARVTGANALVRALKATRPYLEVATGFVHAKELADANFAIRGLPSFFRQHEEINRNVTYQSPRIGIETPLGENDSIALQAGYLFFDQHSADFNNLSLYVLHHHRF